MQSPNVQTSGVTGHFKTSNGWRRVTFGEMAENIGDRVDNPSEAGVERYVGLEHLDPESLKIRRWGTPEEVEATKLRFKPGDIIFGKRRAYQRKLAVADFEGICSAHAMVLRAREETVVKDFLPVFMQSEIFFERALAISVGSLSPTINWKTLAAQGFLIPPKEEQRRIAEILWAVDAEKRTLGGAVMAFEQFGRAISKRLLSDSASPKKTLGEFAKNGVLDIQTGPFGTVLQASSYAKIGTPIINPVNMVDGRLFTEKGPFLDDSECQRLHRYQMKIGDIILGRKGDVGRAVLITKEYEGFIVGSDIIRLRLTKAPVTQEFLYYFIMAPQTREWIAHHASGTTMPGINEKLLSRLAVPVPERDEQAAIVRLLAELDATKDKLSEKIEANMSLTRALTTELLKGGVAKCET